jgi:hypothetical protein
MNSDSAFYIGKTHQVCQDYTVHNNNGQYPFVIVSDGCSGSGHTDIGSRAVALEVNRMVQEAIDRKWESSKSGYFNSDNLLFMMEDCEEAISHWKLNQSCLDATLLAATLYTNPQGELEYHLLCAGDGVLAKVKRDGTIEIIEIEYTSGAPLYLSYELNLGRKQQYAQAFGTERVIRRYVLRGQSDQPVSLTETKTSDLEFFSERGPVADNLILVAMSDGVQHFAEGQKPVESWKVLHKLLQFKNFTGSFAQRRLHKFLKDTAALGWVNNDDVSLAAVYLGDS